MNSAASERMRERERETGSSQRLHSFRVLSPNCREHIEATYLLLLITTSSGNGHLGTLKSPFHLFGSTLSEKLSLSFEEVLEFKSMITRNKTFNTS